MALQDNEGGEWLLAALLTIVTVAGLWLADFVLPDFLDTAHAWISSLFA